MSTESTIRELPVFPLTGVLLLPGTYLPLNIFEPRYRNMVEDALAGAGVIGMIQPEVPGPDNRGVERADMPQLYSVGCYGAIEQSEMQTDGRYLIVLRGLSRFRVARELEPARGYRRVEIDVGAFAADQKVTPEKASEDLDSKAILAALGPYAVSRGLEFELDAFAPIPGPQLVNLLSVSLPFSPADQQALLEASTAAERGELLTKLLLIDSELSELPPPSVPPTLN